jgi:catalase
MGARAQNYQRDGAMRCDDNGGSGPNYYPNSHGALEADPTALEAPAEVSGAQGRTDYPKAGRADDYDQAGKLYRLFTDEQRVRLVDAIVGHMQGASVATQKRQLQQFLRADQEYGARVAKGLGLSV